MSSSAEWLDTFLDDHKGRVGDAAWPATVDETRAWVRGWIFALDQIKATKAEADAASLALVFTPPKWREEHIPAIVGAIRAARKVAEAERNASAPPAEPPPPARDWLAERRAWDALPAAEKHRRTESMRRRYPILDRWPQAIIVSCIDELGGHPLGEPDPNWTEPAPPPPPAAVKAIVRQSNPRFPRLESPAPNIVEHRGRFVQIGPDGRIPE